MSTNAVASIVFLNHWAQQAGGAEYSLIDILENAPPAMALHLITTEEGVLTQRARKAGAFVHIIACSAALQSIGRDTSLSSLITHWRIVPAWLHYVITVRRLIRQLAPTRIHANVPKSHAVLVCLLLSGVRTDAFIHIREIFAPRSPALWLYRIAAWFSTMRFIAISQAVADALPRSVARKSRVIHNGITILPQPQQRSYTPPFSFVYLGRVVPWKGCHLLVDSMAKLVHTHPTLDCTLTIVGETAHWPQSYRQQLLNHIDTLGLSQRCFLKPHTPHPQQELLNHHIFCNASHNEPFGRSIAEAQACGLGVVAFEGGGIGEIVLQHQSGILVPYGDSEAFSRELYELIMDPTRCARMGAAGQRRAAELFDKKKQVPRIWEYLLS
jgi:glycosyltransferase involved in cell wall biosynthesis